MTRVLCKHLQHCIDCSQEVEVLGLFSQGLLADEEDIIRVVNILQDLLPSWLPLETLDNLGEDEAEQDDDNDNDQAQVNEVLLDKGRCR